MSDDAIAVTPVAAQPQQPNESIYQALNAALSATSRGRWFLSEFAKRNRNSESSKMLDAVARIEQAVADPALAAGSNDLVIVRDWAKASRDEARQALETPERQSAEASAQRGARIIREIATSMRAVGNDPRICNILDTQLDSIATALHQIDEAMKAPLAVFDRLIARIDELVPPPPPIPAVPPEPEVQTPPPADPEARLAAVADLAVACATGDPTLAPTPAQIAEDEDILARIAMEMASPDDEPEESFAPAPQSIAEPMAMVASDEDDRPAAVAREKAPAQPSPQIADLFPPAAPADAAAAVSLGQSVLAQGLVQPPARPMRDPFVALKRLTQSEKVALFT